MILFRLDNAATRQILQTLIAGEKVLWQSFEEQSLGDEPRLSEQSVKDLNVRMVDVITSVKGGGSERQLLRDVRETIQVAPFVAGDSGFWRWLTVKYFFDAVQSRHASDGELANEANFGIGGRFEGLITRVWFRADVAYDDGASDPYWLAGRGDQDFWRSHVLRLRYANARTFVRALVKFQYPGDEAMPRLHPSQKDGIRTFVKRIQAFHASSALEMASAELVPQILERLATNLAPGVGA